jgi:hypothetical protein
VPLSRLREQQSYDLAGFLVPTEREEEVGPQVIRLQPLVRDNKNADTWCEMAALTIDPGNNSIPRENAGEASQERK